MIAANQVFQDIEIDPKGPPYLARWKIPASLSYFQGHFPGNPIFPAVGIVDASLYVLRKLLKRDDLFLPLLPLAKFLTPIQPEQTVIIELSLIKDGEWLAEWKEASSQKRLATLRFEL